MGDLSAGKPQWKAHFIIGLIFTIQTFLKWETGIDFNGKDLLSGPWNSTSFSRGVLGLCGGLLLYFSWFRWKFETRGVIPVIQKWNNPRLSLRKLFATGVTILIIGNLIGNNFSQISPGPAGLLLTLIGLLMCLQSGYIWLITEGPLLEEE